MLNLGAWMKSNNFVGTYTLESFEIEETSGLKRSWGKDVHGLLIYTAEGYVPLFTHINYFLSDGCAFCFGGHCMAPMMASKYLVK